MKANFWVKIKGKKGYSSWAQGPVSVSKYKPTTEPLEVAIKFEVEIPDSLFEQPELRANIVIPDSQTSRPIITAEVQENIADILRQQTGLSVQVSYDQPMVEQ